MKEHFQRQSITLIDSPVCPSDSGQRYLIPADVQSLLCETNSVHFLDRTKCLCRCILPAGPAGTT